ncbi:MAG: NADH-quinone oxidoreductase subunit J [Candidatus Methanomethyliaceae archaeon]|nr:NADH-quinone oxidoreductase subunit J [Candidatus Methanomethyliaceae archaeon]MDW7971328.1 NADH-quinone oxidoreductase subunit J [Nitrososphaerota archaeon]
MTKTDLLQLTLIILTIIFAIGTIEIKKLIYAVISFCAMCITIGALYWLLDAHYIAVYQLLLYAGGIVTLFIAAITLTSLKEERK